MSVKVEDNTARIIVDSTKGANLALRFMLDDIDRAARPVTPKKQGNLRNDIVKSVLGLRGTIKWEKNYAIFQEKKQFRNYTTPGTGPHFAENSVKKIVNKADDYFRKARLIT